MELIRTLNFPNPSHTPESESPGRGPEPVIVFKCHRWFWSNLVHSRANIPAKESSRVCVPTPQGQGSHGIPCSHSYVKFKTVCYTFKREKKNMGWLTLWIQLARLRSPLHRTCFPPIFGCTYLIIVLQPNPSVGATAKYNPLGEKTRSPVELKEVLLGKVSGGMPSPLLSQTL